MGEDQLRVSGVRCASCKPPDEENGLLFPLLLSCFCTVPLLAQMTHWIELPLLVQMLLATLVQGIGGKGFYQGAFRALREKNSNMDVLVVLGTSAAYGYSVWVVVMGWGGDVYFEAGSVIISLVLLGQWMEGRCKKNAAKALEELWSLQVDTIRVVRRGEELQLSVGEVCIGDVVSVRPGDKIPLDGKVLEGESEVDESLLTGESELVFKSVGSQVIGGSLNREGFLSYSVEHGIKEGILAQIIHCVEKAQLTKPAPQRLADSIARIFVPVVVGISVLTFGVWCVYGDLREALTYAIAVLVIACPCTLGLATPIVLVVATGIGARAGILFRDADAVDKAGKLQVLVLDKTGTLTEGRPTVVGIQAKDTHVLMEVLVSLEACSEHPLAQAVVEYGKDIPRVVVDKFKAIPGKGVQGVLKGEWVYAGTRSFLEDHGISVVSEGKGTVIYVARGVEYLGCIELKDRVRKPARTMIEGLYDREIEVVMLTGDCQDVALKISEQLGIESFFSEVLPVAKAEHVRMLQSEGVCVGMVGDGINDAPALAQADVSFALRSGSNIAIEVAGITLMRNDLLSILDAIDLSKRTIKKYRQNLLFAFLYNGLGIPIAALGLCNPMIAGAAMALSSLTVVINALTLRYYWK